MKEKQLSGSVCVSLRCFAFSVEPKGSVNAAEKGLKDVENRDIHENEIFLYLFKVFSKDKWTSMKLKSGSFEDLFYEIQWHSIEEWFFR